MRRVDAGFMASFDPGRIGRGEKLPPQFGQTPLSRLSTQSRQNVHSKVQIIASGADGGRSLSQHSQLGRSSSMGLPIPILSSDHMRRRRFLASARQPVAGIVIALTSLAFAVAAASRKPRSVPVET